MRRLQVYVACPNLTSRNASRRQKAANLGLGRILPPCGHAKKYLCLIHSSRALLKGAD